MPHSQAIAEGSPLGTDPASGGAAEFRNLKRDIRERMELEHYWGDDLAGDQQDGRHTNITQKGTGILLDTPFLDGSGYSVTGAGTSPAVRYTGEWNTTGLPTMLDFDVLDTSSDPNSLLLNLKVGGVSKFSVSKTGVVLVNGLPIGDGGGGGEPPPVSAIPAGLIAIFQTVCPSGWTRVTAYDTRFLRGAAVHGGVGGATNHAHTVASHTHGAGTFDAPAHTHGAGSLTTGSHNHGGATGTVSVSGTTGSGGSHTHHLGGSASGTTESENKTDMNVDAGTSGYMARGVHQHDFTVSFDETTDSGGSHTHSFSGSGSGSISSSTLPVSGTSASGGAGAVTGTSAAAAPATNVIDHLPPFIDVIFCRKD